MQFSSLRILYITPHCPLAPSYGAQLRALNIGRLLKRMGKVSLVLASSAKTEFNHEWLKRTSQEFEIKSIIKFIPIYRFSLFDRIRHEIDPRFMKTYREIASIEDRNIIRRMIDEHDVIWIHTIRIANALDIYHWPHSVLDVDDVQSQYYISQAKESINIIKKILNFRMAILWKRRERLFLNRFDTIAVCSKKDKQLFGRCSTIRVIPNGFNLPSQEPVCSPSGNHRIGFIGTLDYMPNIKGLEWFIKSVWMHIKREVPDVHLRLIGNGTDGYIQELGPDIEGLGWLEDTSIEIATWSAMIVPIKIGGGTRMKIAEAFSRKCPVVSTSLGAYGYDVSNNEELLLADNEESFAAACIRVIKSPDLGKRLSSNAWKRFLNEWTWEAHADSVADAVNACLERNNK